ncbi:GlcG/HbpS family heme-binding protein [Pseudobacillus wudalianchiensis]|uniref:DNA polymerase III subunit delta n=1 Tax=Pseudobacillus wudalianchiensis TaxID=1743143 RepID=A0A1B9B7D0_9BACI|nr:heme-binding protein [Bacillus wudalianchiensis]OCA91973.1 DNA polymerase III subunit delta' [Bacillus wudalianchiensis]
MIKITLDVAKEIIAGAEEEAKKIGVSIVISAVDEGGSMVAVHRMDDAWLASIDIAQNMAWELVALKMPATNLAKAAVPAAELYGLNTMNNGRLVMFSGGISLVSDGKVIGAVGVSGSTVPHDVQVAEAAIKVKVFDTKFA